MLQAQGPRFMPSTILIVRLLSGPRDRHTSSAALVCDITDLYRRQDMKQALRKQPAVKHKLEEVFLGAHKQFNPATRLAQHCLSPPLQLRRQPTRRGLEELFECGFFLLGALRRTSWQQPSCLGFSVGSCAFFQQNRCSLVGLLHTSFTCTYTEHSSRPRAPRRFFCRQNRMEANLFSTTLHGPYQKSGRKKGGSNHRKCISEKSLPKEEEASHADSIELPPPRQRRLSM